MNKGSIYKTKYRKHLILSPLILTILAACSTDSGDPEKSFPRVEYSSNTSGQNESQFIIDENRDTTYTVLYDAQGNIEEEIGETPYICNINIVEDASRTIGIDIFSIEKAGFKKSVKILKQSDDASNIYEQVIEKQINNKEFHFDYQFETDMVNIDIFIIFEDQNGVATNFSDGPQTIDFVTESL